MMQAIVYDRYGSPDELRLAEIKRPTPGADELLIGIEASSINSRDWRMLRANPFFIRFMGQGLMRPKHRVLGADVAGRVEAVGNNVRQFRPGDDVYGFLSVEEGGAYAAYARAKASGMAPMPANLSYGQAAAVPLAALTALQGLRDRGKIEAGQRVLIQGGSGGVGTFAVQLAKAFGAQVTAVCSTRNVEMVRGLGADEVIDYKKENVTRREQRFDLIFAVNGYHPINDYMRILAPDGIYVVAGGTMRQLFEAMWRRRGNDSARQKTYVVDLEQSQEDLLLLKEQIEAGKVKPVIDDVYPLGETAEAFRRYEEKGTRGKIVISRQRNDNPQ